MQLISIHLITLHDILEYMQIAIIQTEAAYFVKFNICVILKIVCHDCIVLNDQLKNHAIILLVSLPHHLNILTVQTCMPDLHNSDCG